MLLEVTVAYLVVACSIIWVMISGYSDGSRLVDKAYRFLTIHLPSGMKRSLSRIFGDKVGNWMDRLWDYIVYQNNPLVMYFYLLLLNAGVWSFIWTSFPLLPNRVAESSIHKPLVLVLYFACLFVFTAAIRADPAVITKANCDKYMSEYPRDDFIFKDATECVTCKIPKPPRSKHCRLCGFCVARYDHHCIWLRTCIGAGNLKWFLAFLLVHSLICMYGVYMTYAVLWGEILRRNLLTAQFMNAETRQPVKADAFVLLSFIIHDYPVPFAVLILCGLLSIMLPIFLLYHLNLIRVNMTTNETSKWTAVADPKAQNIYNKGWRANFAEVLTH